jgi:SEC-C motif domain protein
MKNCPCCTGRSYNDCCGVFISGQRDAVTPEELMRSRYTAYHDVDTDYIAKTMKSPAADNFDAKTMRSASKKISWQGLEVVKAANDETKGVVEFIALYTISGHKNILHEISEFNFEDGKWYYVDGKYIETPEEQEEI